MPSIIDQIREEQAWEQPKKPLVSAGFIAGTIAAFAAGIMLVTAVTGWGSLSSFSVKAAISSRSADAEIMPAKKPEISIPAGKRLGNASDSNLLRTCIPSRFMVNAMMPKKDLYSLLQTGDQMMSVASVVGAQSGLTGVGAKGFAMLWGDVADCVFRQNGWTLCEPDNRALAVEAVSAFVRQTALAAAPERDSEFNRVINKLQGKQKLALENAMYNTRATRDRVLATLKMRAQEGRFIAADFGFFAPTEVTQVVRDAKPTSDACASRS